ncbi:hypothetical protein [Bradyrhizobium jicamae]|nr:hypothetical protein [Bradyrhizobium jicamae]
MPDSLTRKRLLRKTAETEVRLALSRRHIARQREIISWQQENGLDAELSLQLLSTFLSVHQSLEHNYGILQEKLAALSESQMLDLM